MKEFLVTLDIMLPILIMLAIGWFLRRINLMTGDVTQGLNKLVFKVFLPVLLFNNIRSMDLSCIPNLGYAAFVGCGMVAVYLVSQLIVPRYVKKVEQSAVVVQSLFRTNFTILGIPLMYAIFGDAGMVTVTLALPIVVPLNNIMAVLSLAPCGGKSDMLSVIKKILTNPLIIGVALGAIFLLLGNPMPAFANEVCSDIGSLTTPLSLLVLGASLRWQGMKDNRRLLTWTLLFKQLFIPLFMVGLSVLLGFRNTELGVLLIVFGAPTAVSSFPMAQQMGGDGELAASLVVLTTILSMGTLFLLIFLCKLCAFF